MNRIDELFTRRKGSVLSVFFTAGYPELHDTALILEGLQTAGADLVEIGFPFSDPVADGPVIQASSHRSLTNGMNLDILFDQLETVDKNVTLPRILMGYYNTVYQYGVEKFVERCARCGVDGAIIPDLPPEIYEKDYQALFEAAGIHFICLAAPQTPPERLRYLAGLSKGFLYLLSSSSTTGSLAGEGLSALPFPMDQIRDKEGDPLPSLIGFGIHDRASFAAACRMADGAIIGTAFIRELKEGLDQAGNPAGREERQTAIRQVCERFIHQIRE
jgi:tryptophan synthase alpha chain